MRKILLAHFEKDPDWSFEKKIEIAKELGDTVSSVGKWLWD